jgi:aminoacrylate peracid reductase
VSSGRGLSDPRSSKESIDAVSGRCPQRLGTAACAVFAGAKAGNALYVSGTLALDSAGNLVGKDDVKAQTRHILETIKTVVEAAGGSLKDITFNHIFLSDMAAYAAMNEVYREYFPKDPPARYCIRADLVRPEFLVEIASIAHVGA